jgi:hypothetical protein
MMLKVMVYAYTQRIYTSRRIAKALRENIQFMWISGMNRPDFRTINRFRSSVMKDVVDEVFTSVLQFLIEKKFVKLENYYVDGTKIESSANRYQFVWGKSTKNYHERLQEKIKLLPGFHVAKSVKLQNLVNSPTLSVKTGVLSQQFMNLEPKSSLYSHL